MLESLTSYSVNESIANAYKNMYKKQTANESGPLTEDEWLKIWKKLDKAIDKKDENTIVKILTALEKNDDIAKGDFDENLNDLVFRALLTNNAKIANAFLGTGALPTSSAMIDEIFENPKISEEVKDVLRNYADDPRD